MRRLIGVWLLLMGLALVVQRPAQVAVAACVRTGTIQVINAEDGSEIGYVGNTFNAYGEYGIATVGAEHLTVRFPDDPRFSLATTNGPDLRVPFLGGIVGFASTSDDLGAGSANYIYLGGTVETPVDAPPSEGDNSFMYATNIMKSIESAIWAIDGNDVITAQWVNSDLSKPATSVMYYEADNALILVGDPDAFLEAYGTFPSVSLVFVESDSTCSQTPTTTPTIPTGTVTASPTTPPPSSRMYLPLIRR